MVSQSYAPVIGGEERVVEDLSVELTHRGHDVAIATLRQPGADPPTSTTGVRVHRIGSSLSRMPGVGTDPQRQFAPPAPDPETVLGLRRIVQREQPDIVHAHNWLVHSYLPLSRRSEAGLVLSLHDYGLVCPTKRLLRKGVPCSGPALGKCLKTASSYYGMAKGVPIALATLAREKSVRRNVDVFLPISEAVRDLNNLGPADCFRVIPNFINASDEQVEEDRLAELPQEPYIMFLGDAREDKGTAYLLEAYRELRDPPPLVLVGRWMFDEPLDQAGVKHLGPQPHPVAMEALRRSDFLVAPSIWAEPFGLMALEAAAAGTPVIASDIGGLSDIVVDRETGLLVEPRSRSALREAMELLIADGELRSRLGAAASHRAKSFSADAIVPQFEEAYERALVKRRSRTTHL